MNPFGRSSEKGFVPAVVLVVLAMVGLTVGVSLVQKNTGFFNRASGPVFSRSCGGSDNIVCPEGFECITSSGARMGNCAPISVAKTPGSGDGNLTWTTAIPQEAETARPQPTENVWVQETPPDLSTPQATSGWIPDQPTETVTPRPTASVWYTPTPNKTDRPIATPTYYYRTTPPYPTPVPAEKATWAPVASPRETVQPRYTVPIPEPVSKVVPPALIEQVITFLSGLRAFFR